MQHFDVLIVGGGPAGASCAWALRRGGLNVAVIDQAEFPRDKTCAGWITPPVLEMLEIDYRDYLHDRVMLPIDGLRAGLIGGAARGIRGIDIRYPRILGYGIRRQEFDDYLLRRAGAQLFTGQPVRSVCKQGGNWLVNDIYRAPMLVGAGGHTCPVARMLGAQPATERAIVAKEIEFLLPESSRADCKVRSYRPELYFSRDLVGYGWCFRKGHYLNLGLGRDDHWQLPQHVQQFIAFLETERGVNLPNRHLNGHAYLLYGRGKRARMDEGVLLVGDAAGLAFPYSGEGIRPAVASGLLAAQTILEAQGHYSQAHLTPYLARLRHAFGRGGSLKSAVIGAIPAWARAALARSLFSSPSLVRRIVLDKGFLYAHQQATL
jgi:menaquinone-9 beta-reductase